jgi:hypothetical protein
MELFIGIVSLMVGIFCLCLQLKDRNNNNR